LNGKGTEPETKTPMDETGIRMNIEWNGIDYNSCTIEQYSLEYNIRRRMVYNRLHQFSEQYFLPKYQIPIQNKKGSASFQQAPCGLQPSVTLFSTRTTVSRPISLVKRLHLPLTLHNISKIP
jgi:hypothetical protein